jgi:isochorismate synthase
MGRVRESLRRDGGLVTRARPLADDVDPLDHYQPGKGFLFSHRGTSVATAGVARSITIPGGPGQVRRAAELAERALAEIEPAGGSEPIVVGALPFDGMSQATLVIPRVALLRRPGEASRLLLTGGPGEGSPPDERAGSSVAAGLHDLEVTPVPETGAYQDAVEEARRLIAAGSLEKVVLARMLMARSPRDFDRRSLLERLRREEPDAYVFAVHGFIGATPELLVSRRRREVRSNPMAGTTPRGTDPASDADAARRLLASEKDRREHAPVVQAVRDALSGAGEHLEVDHEPSAVATGKVWHLSTEVTGILHEPPESALALAARLHPTPAVCGTPPDEAMAVIGRLEAIDRTLYAGLAGWMDASGDGEWAIALRCAEVQGRIALLFAGAGIVEDSDPAAELAETDAKFRSMLDALAWA